MSYQYTFNRQIAYRILLLTVFTEVNKPFVYLLSY